MKRLDISATEVVVFAGLIGLLCAQIAIGHASREALRCHHDASPTPIAPERPDLTDYTPWTSISFMVAHAWREGSKGAQWETVSNAVRLQWERDHFVERGNP